MSKAPKALVHTFGDMQVLTTMVASQNVFLTIVFRGEIVWDVMVSKDMQEALVAHDSFCAACEVFGPVSGKIKSGQITTGEEVLKEVDMAAFSVAPKGSMIH